MVQVSHCAGGGVASEQGRVEHVDTLLACGARAPRGSTRGRSAREMWSTDLRRTAEKGRQERTVRGAGDPRERTERNVIVLEGICTYIQLDTRMQAA